MTTDQFKDFLERNRDLMRGNGPKIAVIADMDITQYNNAIWGRIKDEAILRKIVDAANEFFKTMAKKYQEA